MPAEVYLYWTSSLVGSLPVPEARVVGRGNT